MDLLLSVANKLRSLRADLPEILAEVVDENATFIEDRIVAQLQKGQRGDGEFLPDYSPTSVAKFGKPPGPIRLYDKGPFYSGIFARAERDGIEIDNRDSKTGMLTKRYGVEILELTAENVEIVKYDVLKPGLIEKSRNRLLA
jgi:hypothetical protein